MAGNLELLSTEIFSRIYRSVVKLDTQFQDGNRHILESFGGTREDGSDEILVENVAQEFVNQHGANAISVLHERAEMADLIGDQVAAQTWRDTAYAAERILSPDKHRTSDQQDRRAPAGVDRVLRDTKRTKIVKDQRPDRQ